MPELPEVETVARGVDVLLRSDRIESAWFSRKPEPFKSSVRTMATALPGMRIERVFRVGKHIVFDLGAEPPLRKIRGPVAGTENNWVQWIVHLGMTGRLLVAQPGTPVPPHTHGILYLASKRELRFVDSRRFGRIALHTASSDRGRRFQGSGHEPLSVTPDAFANLFRQRRNSIKAALLNQKILQGIGNIYADESLFRAGIRPTRMAARLKRSELDRLHASLESVLREAISRGGSSISDYVDAEGVKGLFQLDHRVYARKDQPCLICGHPIRKIVVAGRGTHYCPICQR